MIPNSPPIFPHSDPEELIKQYIHRQSQYVYIRNIRDTAESVGFSPDSSLQFWYNDSMTAYAPHWHNAFEMIVPIDGRYLATVGQQTYELMPGDIFLIPSGELHALSAPTRGGRFIFLFDLDLLGQIKGSSYLISCLTQPVLINRSTCPAIYDEEAELVLRLARDYLEEHSLRDMTIYANLLSFLINYGKYRQSLEGNYAMAQFSPSSQKNYAEKISAVLDYMDRHFAEELTLEHVATVAGFSKYHFSRTFKQLSGYNFYDYLLHRRIKSSEMLLMKPGMSISQIALQCGFSSISTFNRTFKKLKGCTPTQYRGMMEVSVDHAPTTSITE